MNILVIALSNLQPYSKDSYFLELNFVKELLNLAPEDPCNLPVRKERGCLRMGSLME